MPDVSKAACEATEKQLPPILQQDRVVQYVPKSDLGYDPNGRTLLETRNALTWKSEAKTQTLGNDTAFIRPGWTQDSLGAETLRDGRDASAQPVRNASNDKVTHDSQAAREHSNFARQEQPVSRPQEESNPGAWHPLGTPIASSMVGVVPKPGAKDDDCLQQVHRSNDVRTDEMTQDESGPTMQRVFKAQPPLDRAQLESRETFGNDKPRDDNPTLPVLVIKTLGKDRSTSAQLSRAREAHLVTKGRLKEALDQNDLLRRDFQKAAQDLNSLQAERNYSIDDRTFAVLWGELRYQIKNWATTYYGGELKSKFRRMLRSTPSTLTGLVNEPVRWLSSPQDRPYLVQAFVWTELRNNIFAMSGPEKGVYWAGSARTELQTLRDLLHPRMHPKLEPPVPTAPTDR